LAARTVITAITLMLAHRTATTGLAGFRADYSLAPVLGMAGVAPGVGADGAGEVAGVAEAGVVAGLSVGVGLSVAVDSLEVAASRMGLLAGSTVPADFTAAVDSTAEAASTAAGASTVVEVVMVAADTGN
jgi:hypothetical protein